MLLQKYLPKWDIPVNLCDGSSVPFTRYSTEIFIKNLVVVPRLHYMHGRMKW